MDHKLVYIEPREENMGFYRRLFQKQGSIVCRDMFDDDYIVNILNNSTFGFMSISKSVNIGRSRLSESDRYTLNGFILCSYHPNDRIDLYIELICARRESRLGKILMKHVEAKALDLGFSRISLSCIAEEGLREWYESLGFEYVKTNYIRSAPKSYIMKKKL